MKISFKLTNSRMVKLSQVTPDCASVRLDGIFDNIESPVGVRGTESDAVDQPAVIDLPSIIENF